MSEGNRMRGYIQAKADLRRDSRDVSVELKDMVSFYAEIEELPGNKAKAERQIIEGIAEDFLENYSYYLHKQGLLEDFFLIAPNPVNLSSSIVSAFNGDDGSYDRALKALQLGGVIPASAVSGNISYWEKTMTRITPEFLGLLIKNMRESEWVLELDRNHSPHAYTRMTVSLFGNLIDGNYYAEAVDILINEQEFLNTLSVEIQLTDIKEYPFLCFLPHSIGQHHGFYQALHDRSPHAYEVVVEANKSSISQHAARAFRGGFSIGKMPPSPQFDADFCAETLSSGIYNGSMTNETYKGLLLHLESKGGSRDSLSKMALNLKKTKEAVKSYLSFSKRLDELGSTCSNAEHRGEMKDRVTAQLYGNIRFIEHLYIKEKDRFFAKDERLMTYVQAGLHYGKPMEMENLFKKHKDIFSNPSMVRSLSEVVRTEEDQRRMAAIRIIEKMLNDDTLRQAFSFVDKTMHEDLFAWLNKKALENMRLVRWTDNGIKRLMLSQDMDI